MQHRLCSLVYAAIIRFFAQSQPLKGIPFPNPTEPAIDAKKKYNDGQYVQNVKTIRGHRWYEIQVILIIQFES